jgi:hypothetical protein
MRNPDGRHLKNLRICFQRRTNEPIEGESEEEANGQK